MMKIDKQALLTILLLVLVSVLLMLGGCSQIAPKVPVEVQIPGYTDYTATMAWYIAEDSEPDLAPIPLPKPPDGPVSTVCPSCDGKGVVGDGRTMVACRGCGGDGKLDKGDPLYVGSMPEHSVIKEIVVPKEPKKVQEAPKEAPRKVGYPIRPSNTWWTGCRDWRHMLGGEHAVLNLDPAWLQGLSNAQLQSLHSDVHDKRVKGEYLVRKGSPEASNFPIKYRYFIIYLGNEYQWDHAQSAFVRSGEVPIRLGTASQPVIDNISEIEEIRICRGGKPCQTVKVQRLQVR